MCAARTCWMSASSPLTAVGWPYPTLNRGSCCRHWTGVCGDRTQHGLVSTHGIWLIFISNSSPLWSENSKISILWNLSLFYDTGWSSSANIPHTSEKFKIPLCWLEYSIKIYIRSRWLIVFVRSVFWFGGLVVPPITEKAVLRFLVTIRKLIFFMTCFSPCSYFQPIHPSIFKVGLL